jgi:hypothetical protein
MDEDYFYPEENIDDEDCQGGSGDPWENEEGEDEEQEGVPI